MKQRTWFALVLVSTALSAGTAAAQHEAPGVAAEPSDCGFVVGMHLTGTTIPDGPQDASRNSGGGLGLTVGYRVDERLTLFARGTTAYRSGNLDFGARYRLGGAGSALRPYLEAAVTRAASSSGMEVFEAGQPVNGMRHTYGMAFTAGAGVEYGITPNLALDVGASISRGRFTTGEFRGEEFDVSENFTTTRLNIGLTWNP